MTSKLPTSDRSTATANRPEDAYLVVHRGSRWTDVIRLTGDLNWSIGRSSANPIVLRSTRSSRRHAEIRPEMTSEGPVWAIADLKSRNGVDVNGTRIDAITALREGDRIEIAGFELRFTRNPAALTSSHARLGPNEEIDPATQDDLQFDEDDGRSEIDIVSQITTSGLERRDGQPATGDSATHPLLAMAFSLGRAESVDACGETLLQTLNDLVPHATVGVYLFSKHSFSKEPNAKEPNAKKSQAGHRANHDLSPPRFVWQPTGTRYRRPPQTLVDQILSPGAPAMLARNILGDRELATENTAGEIDVESIILAPLRRPAPSDDATVGLLHLTTPSGAPGLSSDQLQGVVAAGEIFCQALHSIARQTTLTRSLKKSKATIEQLRSQLSGRIEIIGRSDAIQFVQQQIAQVAPTPSVVLVRGESGSGKELVASAIHHASPRRDGPLVCLNCAALSKDLLESELFGHEKGAFTGATDQKRGKFESASGGTLMLDEIGEMSLDLQAKLLRVLEGHAFERVGGHTPVSADVRVVAATHRDLRAMVQDATFREDLFYRLNVVEIVVPPLRDRGRDIILLAAAFLKTFAESMARGSLKLSKSAEKKLLSHGWPGNVRELRNVIERAVVMSPMQTSQEVNAIDADDLMITPVAGRGTESTRLGASTDSTLSLAELERQHIDRVLQQTGGNKSRAAMILGIERSTLDRKLKRAANQ